MAVRARDFQRKGNSGSRETDARVLDLKVAVDSRQPDAPPPLSISVRKSLLTFRSEALFSNPGSHDGRLFLYRVFSVPEVTVVEIDRTKGIGRVHYDSSANTSEVLARLGRALTHDSSYIPGREGGSQDGEFTPPRGVDFLYLDGPPKLPIRISRIRTHVTTWTVRRQRSDWACLFHPILRNQKDIAYRLEEELTAVQGVRAFKTNLWTATVKVRFNPSRVDVGRLVRHLEHSWPRLIAGLEGPPPKTRFFASFSMLGLAFTGQYLVPAVTPFALVAVAIYGSANVLSAIKSLRRGNIGLPVLYTGTLTFTLLSGMPFSACLMASFMQLWPHWAYRTMTTSQRRLFATHRQRATWARLAREGELEIEVSTDRLKTDDLIHVYEGEIIPVDGVVTAGLAAVDEESLRGRAGAFDKAPGDTVYAATFVRSGRITVRVKKVGVETLAGHIGAQLPHGRVHRLPSSADAEQIANGMVAPVMALSGVALLVTGEMQPSQSTIRADYATSPRVSSQMVSLYSLSDALRRGIVFRDPAALDRLPATDIYAFDDTPALERRRIAVGEIIAAPGASANTVLSYVTSAFPAFQNERARALMDECVKNRASLLEISERKRHAGVISYRDADNRLVEVATPAYIETHGFKIPSSIRAAVAASSTAWADRRQSVHHIEPQLRPLWLARDGVVQGVVTFERSGELEAVEVIATLRARNARARFIHLSSHPQAKAEEIAGRIGIHDVTGGLDTDGKVRALEKLGRRTMWIGNGSAPEAAACINASTISISVAGSPTIPQDAANIALLQPSLRSLVPLRRIGRRHRALIKEGYRSVFAANLICLGGALFGGFDNVIVALISNFGTGYVFVSERGHLNSLIARVEAKMARDSSFESEDHDPQEGTTDAGYHEMEEHEAYHERDLDAPVEHTKPV